MPKKPAKTQKAGTPTQPQTALDRVRQHMRSDCLSASIMAHKLKAVERVNVHLVLDEWFKSQQPKAKLIGYSAEYRHDNGLSGMVARDDLRLAPVEFESMERDLGKHVDVVLRGIYLMHLEGHPVTFMARVENRGHSELYLEIMAPDRSLAQRFLAKLLDESHARNIYRGKVISVGTAEHCWPRETIIQFHDLPPASRETIILPQDVMTVVERNVLGLLRHGQALADAGRSARHGVLFHGPPGTGKTLAVRYLVSACKDHTVILLSGRQLGLIRESCQIARLLSPSIVVLEDVDLIAMQREHNEYTTMLHELMDEMDGLGKKTPTVFLLTTNRPELLEQALAARPGRVDQAIAFPLPDSDGRRRIFELYGRGLNLSRINLLRWVDQTEGVSPAFIEELLRKSALFAAERNDNGHPLSITDDDVSSAVHELVYFGGELTQKLLGYKLPKS